MVFLSISTGDYELLAIQLSVLSIVGFTLCLLICRRKFLLIVLGRCLLEVSINSKYIHLSSCPNFVLYIGLYCMLQRYLFILYLCFSLLQEYTNLDCIYICEFCLKYRKSRKCLERHLVSIILCSQH